MGTCCVAAPPSRARSNGKVVQGWGQGVNDTRTTPRNPHGIFVDHNDFVWIGTYMHHRVQKFTRDGKLVLTIGQYDKNAGSNDTTLLGGPSGIWVDPKTNEAFISDGYRNRRVIVFDGGPASPCATGAPTATSPTTPRSSTQDDAGGRCRSSSPPARHHGIEATGRSTSPIAAAIASRCSSSRANS